MAAQRTTKRSCHTSNTRQRTESAQEQLDDCSDDVSISDSNAESMDVDDQGHDEQPQETRSRSAQELLSNMVAGARKRHIAKLKNVLESYARTNHDLETSLNTLFDQHEDESSAAHQAQLKRLAELLNHKAKLEAAMDAKLLVLRASYAAHSRDVENVLHQRIKELK
ncbi:hypothetical protein BDU57DRAFT_508304 [Ampelomyces quisqualis]|uniref:Uncharacterized protein n=1 Tax=Ampelomyces quisqualis TaxID=50730 RepID=A0A6A5QWP7_AMPQU|nr:hypothetical protein BDU57DRAFT_508304 [Ampelomyces quisqualis]